MHTSKSDIWMPIYIGDLLGDTQHLTNEQFGIYHKLFYHQWRHGHFSEEDMVAIAGFSSHISEPASSTTQAVLEQRFSRVLATIKQMLIQDRDGRWFSRRCDLEKAKWFEKKRVFVERARKGGVAKAKRMREKLAASSSASSVPEGMLEGCTSPVEVQEQKQRQPPPTPSAARRGIEAASAALPEAPPDPAGRPGGVAAIAPASPAVRPAHGAAGSQAAAKSEHKGKTPERPPVGASADRNGATQRSVSTASAQGNGAGRNGHKNLGVRPSKTVSREIEFEREVLEYWKGQNPKHPKLKFQPADHRALEALLKGDPEMDLKLFRELLKNRAQSDVNPAALPHKWLRGLMEYASGSLGKFGKPLSRSRPL